MRAALRGLVRRDDGYSPHADAILGTGLFDAPFYRAQAGLGRAGDRAAAHHYATVGEKLGLMPNPVFDPALYADLHRAEAIAAMGFLLHYVRYGRDEGRIAFIDVAARVRDGAVSFDPHRATVLLVCHEATRTGAPILGWNLARHLARDHNVVIAILQSGGDLHELFAREAVTIAGPFLPKEIGALTMRRLVALLTARARVDHVLANSIECTPFLFGMLPEGLPTVLLVHEFAPNVYPPGKMTNGLMLATQVVFDAEVQRRAALDEWPGITARNQHVFHQGASAVPRAAGSSADPAEIARQRDAIRRAVAGRGDVPVVLGLGTLSMRKAPDLFVACAQAVAGALGADRVRFVWIGGRPKPHPEGNYPDWIADHVKRAGLGGTVAFLDEVEDLDGAFAASALLLVPSRLDPFPNIAMDAALAGVPPICFSGANGFADYLAADDRTRALAVPYLDVAAAAAVVIDLLRDPARRRAIGARLKERAARDFPMERYVARLAGVVDAARVIAAQEARDIATIATDDTFSVFLWCDPGQGSTREEAIRLHVRKAASGQEAVQYCRRPALGFVPQTYADHHSALNAAPFENPLAHWLRAGKPDGPWCHPVVVASARAPRWGTAPRCALHLHLFYPELADPILARLAANAAAPDLFVSTTDDDKAEDIRRRLAGYDRGAVTIRTGPNRGRDIGPMLTLFADALRRYPVVGHLHGKRSLALTAVGHSLDLGVQWQEFLLQHLLGDRVPMADIILDRFADDAHLGLVFPEDPNLTGWSLDRDLAVLLARRMDPTMVVPPSIDFPIGTMFWARPEALAPLFDLRLGWDDYPEEPVPIDGTMLHALERLLPVICRHAGFTTATTHVPGVTR